MYLPELRGIWDAAQEYLQAHGHQLDAVDDATPLDVIPLAHVVGRSELKKRAGEAKDHIVGMASNAIERMAEGVELWIAAVYTPQMQV